METHTPFDLNRAIQQWRAQLAQSPAIRGEKLDELEAHLRDSVAGLQAHTLSDEEAFLLASHRIGNPARLQTEFGKANPTALWLDRCFWAIVIMQAWWIVSNIFEGISRAVFNLTALWMTNHHGHALIPASLGILFTALMYLLPFAIFTLSIRWLLMRPRLRLNQELRDLANKPAYMSLALFSLATCTQLLFFTLFYFTLTSTPATTMWEMLLQSFLVSTPRGVIFAIVTYLLARKRLATSALVPAA